MFDFQKKVPFGDLAKMAGLLPKLFGALMLLAGLVFLTPQVQAAYEVDAGGKCPRIKKNTDLSDEDRLEAIFDANKQVVTPNAFLYQQKNLEESVENIELVFGDNVVVVERDTNGAGTVLFVKKSGSNVCGWLEGSAVLSVTRPVKLINLPGYDLVDSKGILDTLVLVKNQFDEAAKKTIKAKIFDAPGGQAIQDLSIFSLYSVFGLQYPDGRECKRWDDERCFLLIGGVKEVETEVGNIGTPSVLGWVMAKDIEIWPSSVSMYYGVNPEGLKFYKNKRDIEANPEEEFAAGNKTFREPGQKNIPRFPILQRDIGEDNQNYYEVLFIGRACRPDGSDCLDADQFSRKQDKIGTGSNLSEEIDILFVIDATKSMDRYYPLVVKAVRESIEAAENRGKKVRMAAVVYSDYKTTEGGLENVDVTLVAPFSEENEVGRIKNLNNVRRRKDKLQDLPEAPYAAVIRAVDMVEWRDKVFRLVVLIGDHGNRPIAGEKYKEVSGDVSAGDVAQVLKDRQIAFTAVQVRGSYDEEANTDFWDDVAEVISEMGVLSLPAHKTGASDAEESDDNIISQISAAIDTMIEASHQAVEGIGDKRTGRKAGYDNSSLPEARLAKHYVEKILGLTDNDFKDLTSRVQLVLPGWVRFRPRSRQARFWLALRLDELRKLANASQNYCDKLEYASFKKELVDTMVRTLEALTHDKISADEKISQFLEKKLDIPADNFSELLQGSITDFAEKYFREYDNQKRAEYRADVCIKSHRLGLVLNDKKVEIKKLKVESGTVVPVDSQDNPYTKFEWWWSPDRGVKYYYVPLDFIL
jgi:hypothetical protein